LWKWLSYKINERNKILEQKFAEKIEKTNYKWNEFKKLWKEMDPVVREELKARYNKYGKTEDERVKELKEWGHNMWRGFIEDEINDKWNYKWMIDFEREQEGKNKNKITDSPFKTLNINESESLDNPMPSTSGYKPNWHS